MFLDVSADLLSQGYGVRFRPGGHSMRPTIRDGEAVTVEPVEPGKVKKGDIILCRTTRGLIAHRVVRIERREDEARVFHLRGDASNSCDAPVSAEQILGRVVSVERNKRTVSLVNLRAKILGPVRAHVFRLKARLWAKSEFHGPEERALMRN
jgi:signal peptidase